MKPTTLPRRFLEVRALVVWAGALCLTLGSSPARAQFSGPPQDQSDLTLDASMQRATFDGLATALEGY